MALVDLAFGHSVAGATSDPARDEPDDPPYPPHMVALEPAADVLRPVGPPARPLLDAAERDAFIAKVRSGLPDLKLLTDEIDRETYRRDETEYLDAGLPLAVALPTTTDQTKRLVRLCAEEGVPIVPRGAGSGLSGGAAGIDGALTVAFTAMDKIIEIDDKDLVAIVEPGIINAKFKAAVADRGLFYPPDPASYEICSIGGNLGTNAGGLCCVKYGQTRDSVLGLEVVLADGSVIQSGGRMVKDVAGYALSQLLVGSQGTLALVTKAWLRLRPAPPPRLTLIAFFPTLDAAGAAVAGITAAGLDPVTLEMLDQATIVAVDDFMSLGLDRSAAAMLLVESDLRAGEASYELDAAAKACEDAGATDVVRARDAQEADWLRQGRRLGLRALERIGTVRMEDVGVPRSRVPELVRAIVDIADRHGIRCATFGHVGDGNLHPNFIFERDDPTAEQKTEAARDELYRAAIALGGTMTAEHGVGASRRPWLELQRGADAMRAMRSIKAALDPQGLLNPGRVL